jgi:hypothetical protein
MENTHRYLSEFSTNFVRLDPLFSVIPVLMRKEGSTCFFPMANVLNNTHPMIHDGMNEVLGKE